MGYRVFISCGQRAEKRVGERLHTILAEGGHSPFFAGTAHSFNELGSHIFANLASCEAYLAVLHPRGEVRYPGIEETEIRGSVWIHQELAILAYGRFLQDRSIPLCVLMEASIRREGVMDNLIINPHLFHAEEEIYPRVEEWMQTELVRDPIETSREHLFRRHTQDLKKDHWQLLLLCVLHRSTDGRADRDQVIRDFEAMGGNRTVYSALENTLRRQGLLEGPFTVDREARQVIGIRSAWLDLIIARLRDLGELK